MSKNVFNVTGTKDRDCKCGSWIDHWLKYNEEKILKVPPYCYRKNCKNKELIGAHIRENGSQKEFIVPLCKTCNQELNSFVIDSYKVGEVHYPLSLADAVKSVTCEKK